MSKDGDMCMYHYDHNNRIKTLEADVKRLEEKNESLIKVKVEVEKLTEEIGSLKEFIEAKALKLKYIVMTISGVLSTIIVGAIELLKWLL